MKVSIISHDLSNNCLGRALVIAQLLRGSYEVEIIGRSDTGKIWAPALGIDIPIRCFPKETFKIGEFLKAIDGHFIYAIKPRTTSFGYGLLKKLMTGKKLLLDIDDWELGFFLDEGLKYIPHHLMTYSSSNNFLFTYLLEYLSWFANGITVSSTKLQKKFGGTIIPHVRDADVFNASRIKIEKIKQKMKLKTEKVVMFLGTPKLHKGIEDIISALDALHGKNFVFVIIGASKSDVIPRRPYIRRFNTLPISQVPDYLSIADVVVLPQREKFSAWGQIPAKLIDAMAMSKPVISTKVSDIPDILGSDGIITEPGNTKQLTDAIAYIFDHPAKAKKMGQALRSKFMTKYSLQANKSLILKLVNKAQV